MAQLAIKGHKTRGGEIIKILEMLGANNTYHLKGNENYAYYVNECGEIRVGDSIFGNEPYIIFTLEEFLEKFPYEVGDKVKVWVSGYRGVFNIQDMTWDSIAKEVKYKIRGCWLSAENLQPYKEETMEEIKIAIPDGYEFFGIDDDSKIVLTKKQFQYPKTIEECAKVLSTLPHTRNGVSGYSSHTLWKLQQLLICRDAYWKIAGVELGLDKPWEPDWDNEDKRKHVIICQGNNIIKDTYFIKNTILAFPTEEMRDAFYENFKDLIEECKEFL